MAPIHDAARDADVETLRRLLAEGVSPNATLPIAETPLHCLCLRDNGGDCAACFELLRDAGANLEATDFLNNRPLHCAVWRGNAGLLSLLVQSCVNLDATTNGNSTALHVAALTGATDCVEVLLAAGATPNLLEENGRTPFRIAITQGHSRLWPLFLRAGAEIPTNNTRPYIVRVRNAGGFRRYAQQHLARVASILETPLLPPELVRKVLEYWLHAGYY